MTEEKEEKKQQEYDTGDILALIFTMYRILLPKLLFIALIFVAVIYLLVYLWFG